MKRDSWFKGGLLAAVLAVGVAVVWHERDDSGLQHLVLNDGTPALRIGAHAAPQHVLILVTEQQRLGAIGMLQIEAHRQRLGRVVFLFSQPAPGRDGGGAEPGHQRWSAAQQSFGFRALTLLRHATAGQRHLHQLDRA